MADADSPLLTRIEAAAFCRVSARAFDQHVRDVVPTVRIGSRVLFHRQELEAWLLAQGKARETAPSSAALLEPARVAPIVAPRPKPQAVVSPDEFIRRGSRARRGGGRG